MSEQKKMTNDDVFAAQVAVISETFPHTPLRETISIKREIWWPATGRPMETNR